MMWEIIVAILIVFFFLASQAKKTNPERGYIHTVFCILSVAAVAVFYGGVLTHWEPVVFYGISALYIYQSTDLSLSELLSMFLFVCLTLVSFLILNSPPLLILSVPIISLLILVVFSKTANLLSVSLSSVSLMFVLYFLGVEFGVLAWLNPSFILPETVVPSQLFYTDYYGHLVSIVVLLAILSIYGSIGTTLKCYWGTPYLIGVVLINFLGRSTILPFSLNFSLSLWLVLYVFLVGLVRRADQNKSSQNDLSVFIGLLIIGIEIGMSVVTSSVLIVALLVLTYQILSKTKVLNIFVVEMSLGKSFIYVILGLNVLLLNSGHLLPFFFFLIAFVSFVEQLNQHFAYPYKEKSIC